MCKEEREKLQKGDKIFCLECGTELVTIDKIYNTGITIIRSWRNWTGESPLSLPFFHRM